MSDLLTAALSELEKQELSADELVDVISKRLRQAFSQIGGKSAVAKQIIGMMPPHNIYVEPFCGGAAVFFRKDPSQKEVLADMSEDVIFILKAIQQLDDASVANLQQRDWIVDRDTFIAKRDEYRAGQFANSLDKLYCLLYLRHAVFGSGDPSKSVDVSRLGQPLTIANDLPDIRARLSNVQIVRADARDVIKSLDSPGTFFYLDPPYPVGTGQRKDYAYGGEFTMQDLAGLFEQLKTIQGKFLMSIPAIVAQYVPQQFHTSYISTPVLQGPRRILSQELTVTNYQPPQAEAAPSAAVQQSEYEVIKSDPEKQLLWLIVMKPYFVDYENQWSSPETILDAAHKWLLNGGRIYMEHSEDISDRVKPVESYTVPSDQKIGDRAVKAGTWIIVVYVEDKALWDWANNNLGTLGASVRGMATLQKGKTPPIEAGRVRARMS